MIEERKPGTHLVASEYQEVYDKNCALALQINAQALSDPGSPYAGKFVGIANGQVVVVADDFNEVATRLKAIEPIAAKTFCLQAGFDYDEPQYIWSMP